MTTRKIDIWYELTQLVPAPAGLTAVYLLADGTLYRQPVLYAGIYRVIGHRYDSYYNAKPPADSRVFEETRTHWMVASTSGQALEPTSSLDGAVDEEALGIESGEPVDWTAAIEDHRKAIERQLEQWAAERAKRVGYGQD